MPRVSWKLGAALLKTVLIDVADYHLLMFFWYVFDNTWWMIAVSVYIYSGPLMGFVYGL